jgi:Tfp pilus assembly major pilin PilA
MIELMIVVAIMAILGAIAVPAFEYYRGRALLTAMLAEVSRGKVGVELLTLTGVYTRDPGAIGLSGPTRVCPLFYFSYGGAGANVRDAATIACQNGQYFVTIQRLSDSEWTCVAHNGSGAIAGINWLPKGCREMFP